jgi:hypothetical protein
MSQKKNRPKKKAVPIDYEGNHIRTTLRDCADALESHYRLVTGLPEEYVAGLAESFRFALKCKLALFAGRPNGMSEKGITIICPRMDEEEEGRISRINLESLFKKAIDIHGGVYCHDVTSDREPLLCCAKNVQIPIGGGQHLNYGLLVVIMDRDVAPDPNCPSVKFLTYDELFLRVAFAHFALYVKHEHSVRRMRFSQACEDSQEQVRVSEIGSAAQKVLEFESLVGLPTDPDVLGKWIEAEKSGFLIEDTRRMVDFQASLEKATEWLKDVEDKAAFESLRRLLFECHLAQLTKERKLPLLSQRIAQAEELAGIHSTAGA